MRRAAGRATGGRVVWDADAYAFLDAECPDTVNPSLWRQSRLAAIHGLFEVAEGIYQVRGLDLSSMTIVEGDRGVLVIDPLISTECAAAALALYRRHRGDRPVTGLLYTHSHVDHFGGARGVVTAEEVASGRVPVIAPDGFLAHAVSENVYAGGAMTRRATYMYGALLPKGPAGQVGAGLGQTTSTGTVTLIPPDFIVSLSAAQLFDALAIQIDGPRAGDRSITLDWRFTDTGEAYAVTLRHGVLTHRPGTPRGDADAVVRAERSAVDEVVAGSATLEALMASGRLAVEGDQAKLAELLGLLDPPDPNFPIVTP